MAPAGFLDTCSDRPEIVGSTWSGHVPSSGKSGVSRETARGKVPPREAPRQSYLLILSPMQDEPDGGLPPGSPWISLFRLSTELSASSR
jgi:hypothetical protein